MVVLNDTASSGFPQKSVNMGPGWRCPQETELQHRRGEEVSHDSFE